MADIPRLASVTETPPSLIVMRGGEEDFRLEPGDTLVKPSGERITLTREHFGFPVRGFEPRACDLPTSAEIAERDGVGAGWGHATKLALCVIAISIAAMAAKAVLDSTQ